MKKPPLLPTLALTALAGASVFLITTLPSCDPRNAEARGPTEPAAQQRAFTAAVTTPVTADEDFRPKDAANITPPNKVSGFAATARTNVSRRLFLMNPKNWEPGEQADKIAAQAAEYHRVRMEWIRWLTGTRGGISDMPNRMSAARKAMDLASADRSRLTKTAQASWDDYEQDRWQLYEVMAWTVLARQELSRGSKQEDYFSMRSLPEPHSPPAENAASYFQARRNWLIRPLLNQLEELDDFAYTPPPFVVFNSANTETSESPAQAADRRRQSDLAARLREQLDDILSQSRILSGRWTDRAWEGFEEAARADPNVLPAVPKPAE